MTDDDCTRGLDLLADEAEPAAVDCYDVIAKAKARTRNRRATMPTALATVTVAGAMIATIGLADPASGPPVGGRPTITSTPMPAQTPEVHDNHMVLLTQQLKEVWPTMLRRHRDRAPPEQPTHVTPQLADARTAPDRRGRDLAAGPRSEAADHRILKFATASRAARDVPLDEPRRSRHRAAGRLTRTDRRAGDVSRPVAPARRGRLLHASPRGSGQVGPGRDGTHVESCSANRYDQDATGVTLQVLRRPWTDRQLLRPTAPSRPCRRHRTQVSNEFTSRSRSYDADRGRAPPDGTRHLGAGVLEGPAIPAHRSPTSSC